MTSGKTVEYIDQGKFICTICLEDKNGRLHLLTTHNRQLNVSIKRVLLISSHPLDDPSRPREELLAGLRSAEERRNTLVRDVRVRELWELIHDENQSYDYRYLAELCFGEGVDDDHISALVRALFQDSIHFKLKDGRFQPNTPERIDEIVRQRREEARLERLLSEGSEWLRRSLEGEPVVNQECVEDTVRLLCGLALHGNDFPEYKQSRELLSRAGYSDPRVARKLLVKLGVWDQDEDLDILRLQLRNAFSDDQIASSQALKQAPLDTIGREDLRSLETLTIDGPETLDFDDALSLELKDGGFEIGVHITDVAGSVLPDSPIDREAFLRGASLYLPRNRIQMIPPSLSQGALSLINGCDRPAISMFCRMNSNAEILDFRFTPSIIRVKRQLTYGQVNKEYEEDTVLGQMHNLAAALQQKRIEKGALVLSTPEPLISVDGEGKVAIKLLKQDSPARLLVAEFMILYNWLAARFCRDGRIPILYRLQGEPSERLKREDMDDPLFFVFMQRRKLQPLSLDTNPAIHAGLGLEEYTNVTSPIRRYLDLVTQRQIRSALRGEPLPYDAEALEKIRIRVEANLKDIAMVRRNRNRYWTQKYLQQNRTRTLEALVLWSLHNRHRILLTDVMLVADLKRKNGRNLEPGSRIHVAVEKSDPWEDILVLNQVDDSA